MSVIIGIDVGGSTTKITGFRMDRTLIEPIFVHATDPVTSVYGAFGKFTSENELQLSDIARVMITGIGSSCISSSIFNLPCTHVSEFRAVGCGGLYLSGLSRAVVVSMGTGTATTLAQRDGNGHVHVEYLGGTGVGGGTLMGLSKRLLAMDSIEHIVALAKDGDLSRVDLRVGDITSGVPLPTDMSASNFGKLSDVATPSDIALGLINMIFETVAMISLFAARQHGVGDIVMTGNLTKIPQAAPMFENLSRMFGVRFLCPERSNFGTVIGTALSYFDPEEPQG